MIASIALALAVAAVSEALSPASGRCASAGAFVVRTRAGSGADGCVSYPEIATLPRGPFAISDAFPMPYFITAPCHNLTKAQTNCTKFADATPVSPAWADSDGQCYALGSLDAMTVALVDPADAHSGVMISYGNGVGGAKNASFEATHI